MAQKINAVLLLDKASGVTSNRALTLVKRLFDAAKAGHCGTLDPLATGLLPVCFGEATKFSRFMLDAEKTYEATLRLGETTTSGDCEGEITRVAPVHCGAREIENVLERFVGSQTQIPPMLSALKHNGAPLYALARRGQHVERAPRPITISRIRLIEFDAADVKIEVACSKGTYIRVLAEDIGVALGCGAHLKALRRTAAGALTLERAYTLQELQETAERESKLLPLDTFVRGVPSVVLDDSQVLRLRQGQIVAHSHPPIGGALRCYDQTGRFLGVGTCDPPGQLKATRLLAMVPLLEGSAR